MVSRDDIQRFVDQVARRFRPTAVILFGSYAYGCPTENSDVDLMVIMPRRGAGAQMATRIRLACPRSFPMDLLVRSPAEIERLAGAGDALISQITSKGIVLHECRGATVG
jgi:predicted nucleotidyltransferase